MNSSMRSKRSETMTVSLYVRTNLRLASVLSRSRTSVGPSTCVRPDGLGGASGSCPPQCSTILPSLKRNRSKARRSAVTFEALVSGMQQDEIAVHKRAIDRDVGARRGRDFRGKRPHSGTAIGESRIMLNERFAKIPIDGCRIFLAKDIDHGLARVGA
jgi:hypothetical protein